MSLLLPRPDPKRRADRQPSTRRIPGAAVLLVCGVLLAPGAAADPPELAWSIYPGDGETLETDSETARDGPLSGSASNQVPGASAAGSVSVDYGSVTLETGLEADFSMQGAALLCPPGHCASAVARWSDVLVFRAPGHVAPGDPGSFTAELDIQALLAATRDETWLSPVYSQLTVDVLPTGNQLEEIDVLCIAGSDPEVACAPGVSQTLISESLGFVIKSPGSPGMGAFQLGPYDFTWGEPFAIEVQVIAADSVALNAGNAGGASAGVDLTGGLSWTGVVELFDAVGGGGNPIPLEEARVSPYSGRSWLQTVPLPEPGAGAGSTAALATAAWLGRRRSRRTRLGS